MSGLEIKDRKRIRKERATILAQQPVIREAAIQYENIVEFLVDQEKYGIPTNFVREVLLMKDVTKIPGVPDYVMGIVNVRGQIFSVIDIKTFFQIPRGKGISNRNRVIIIQNENMEYGIIADAITGVKSIPFDKIVSAPLTMSEFTRKYVKGVTEDQLIILDAEHMLTDKSIIVCEDV